MKTKSSDYSLLSEEVSEGFITQDWRLILLIIASRELHIL